MQNVTRVFICGYLLVGLSSFAQKSTNKLPDNLIKIINDSVKGQVVDSAKNVPKSLYVYMDTMQFRYKKGDYPFKDNPHNEICCDLGTFIAFLWIKENYVFVGYWSLGNATHDYLGVFDLTTKQVILDDYSLLSDDGHPATGRRLINLRDVPSLIKISKGPWFEKIRTIKM